MRRLFTLGLILFVPFLSWAQIELQVFYSTDQKDVYETSDIRSMVFGADQLILNQVSSDVQTYAYTEFDSLMLDEKPPLLSDVSTGTIESGADISATSSKDGTLFLVPDGTPVTFADFETAVSDGNGVSEEATANTAVTISTTGLDDGDYLVYAVDEGERISEASDVITLVTYYPPVLSDVTTGTIEPGDDVSATSDKDGTIYLVPEGTSASVDDFTAAVNAGNGVSETATADTPVTLNTTGLTDGNYVVYAVDGDGRISDPSAAIELLTTGLETFAAGDITLFPNPVGETLNIDSEVMLKSLLVTDLLGKEIVRIDDASGISRINTSSLDAGIYCIQLATEKQTVTYKFIKK